MKVLGNIRISHHVFGGSCSQVGLATPPTAMGRIDATTRNNSRSKVVVFVPAWRILLGYVHQTTARFKKRAEAGSVIIKLP